MLVLAEQRNTRPKEYNLRARYSGVKLPQACAQGCFAPFAFAQG